MVRVFANGPGDLGSILFKSYQRLKNTSPAFAGPSGIRARWSIEIKGRFKAERPPVSPGPPLGKRAATLTPLSPLYSTRPCCLV